MKLKMLTLAALAALSVAAMAPISLDGSWEFRFDEAKSWQEVSESFAATDIIVVPGCFDAMPKWFMKRGTGSYRRTFTLDKPVDNAYLVIDGMGLYGAFKLDGRDIGENPYPYSRVELETGPLSAGTHTLFAAVDNRIDWSYQKLARPYYDFHFWGGFYHGVSLSFEKRKFLVRTRDYSTGKIEIEAVGFDSADFDATLLFDGKTDVTASFKGSRATVSVPNFKLWSPDAPCLHTVALKRAKHVAGEVVTRFGIRTIEAKNGGFYLNGKRIFLKGANRHEQFLLTGVTTPESIMLKDIHNLKAMGANFLRGAHYPQSQRFLELCDEHGIMVWEESLGWGNGQKYTYPRTDGNNELIDPIFISRQLEQTTLMVRNSFNHPSVIIFSFLNECNSATKECKALVDQLIAAIKKEDSGRLVTFACNMISGDIANENTDLIAFNTYPGTINGYAGSHDEFVEKIHNMKGHGIDWAVKCFQEKYPGKTIMISEIGSAGMYGLRDPSSPKDSEDFQYEHNQIVAETVWANPGVAGLAYWQFFDTRTCGRDCFEDSKKHIAMSWAGIFDEWRRPKTCVRMITDWFTNKTPANLLAK